MYTSVTNVERMRECTVPLRSKMQQNDRPAALSSVFKRVAAVHQRARRDGKRSRPLQPKQQQGLGNRLVSSTTTGIDEELLAGEIGRPIDDPCVSTLDNGGAISEEDDGDLFTLMDRDFWESFMMMYKQYRCLWDSKLADYTNRTSRDKAYADLVEFCQTRYPRANRDFVAKKIHQFRCSFRREYRKVLNSTRSAKSAVDIYRPTLWYYNLLIFIADSEQPQQQHHRAVKETNGDVIAVNDRTSISPSSLERNDTDNNYDDEKNDEEGEQQKQNSSSELYDVYNICSTSTDHVDNNNDGYEHGNQWPDEFEHVNEIANLTTTAVDSSSNYYHHQSIENEFDLAGKKFSTDLRQMDYEQRVFTEKLVAEIIFYGKLGKLDENCRIQL